MSDEDVPSILEETAPGDGRTGRRHTIALAVLALLLIITIPLWPRALAKLAYFRVRKVEIQGARYIAPSEILQRLAVDTTTSVWHPLAPLGERVASHPGLRSARVRRRLPGTLVVSVQERVPVALVPSAQGFRVYDERGTALPIDLTRVPVDAPIALQRDTAIFRLLGAMRTETPTLYRRLDDVRREGRDELTLTLDSVRVRAMTDVTPVRLQDLEPVELDLAKRRVRAAELDLRFRDQVIARLP